MAVIAVARQLGSLGDEIAEGLARVMRYRFVDRQALVLEIEKLSGSEVPLSVPEIQEKQPTFWERLNEDRRRYNALLRSALLILAEADNAVILGSGAGFVLRSFSHVFSALAVASPQTRIERVAQGGTPGARDPTDPDRARDLIRQSDRERGGYVRYLFNTDWLEAHRYDLVLCTNRLKVEEGVGVLLRAVEAWPLEQSPESAHDLAQATLAARVETSLLSRAGIWVNALRVTAHGGVVAISGEVITEEDRAAAEEVAMALPGVTQVQNDLRIQPPPLTGM